jgi:hypothetical protein
MPQASLAIDVKRRRLLLMERAEAFVVTASLLQRDVGAGQLNKVNSPKDFLLEICSQAAAHTESLVSPSDNAKGPYLCGDKALRPHRDIVHFGGLAFFPSAKTAGALRLFRGLR